MSTIRWNSLAAERVEDDRLVHAIQEFGLEVRAQRLVDPSFDLLLVVFRQLDDVFAAEVGSHDQHRVAEVDRAALAIGQAAVVEDLEQRTKDIRVGLLDLVEEHDAVGPSSDGFRQMQPPSS